MSLFSVLPYIFAAWGVLTVLSVIWLWHGVAQEIRYDRERAEEPLP